MLDSPVYSLLARKRVRIVLEAIEDDLRDGRSEDQFVVRNKLEVEHVLPQSWSAHWPLPPAVDPLHLNKRILELSRELGGWGEEAIRARSELLFERAVKIWPRP
jgi:hypothetical protein